MLAFMKAPSYFLLFSVDQLYIHIDHLYFMLRIMFYDIHSKRVIIFNVFLISVVSMSIHLRDMKIN